MLHQAALKSLCPLGWDSTVSVWARHHTTRHSSLPRPSARPIVVFADPDTLRDRRHSSLAETREALDGLADRGVAVVLWGNETRAEMELIRADLEVRHPFVSESGGGLFVPGGYFTSAPAERAHVRRLRRAGLRKAVSRCHCRSPSGGAQAQN